MKLKEKAVYLLYVSNPYADVYCHFALCKLGTKQWIWVSLNQVIATDAYISCAPLPKWKAINWAMGHGIVTKVKIRPNKAPEITRFY